MQDWTLHSAPDVVRRRRRPSARAGFSFAEVLFAVIILAVGFILVAAIFPVAIQQTQSTAEDAAAAAAAREGTNAFASLPTVVPNPQYTSPTGTNPASAVSQLTLFPPTVKKYQAPTAASLTIGSAPPPAIVVPLTGRAWESVRGNLINPSDSRYAYVPFYRRENGSSVAQLIVIGVAARNRPSYDLTVDTTLPATSAYTGGTVTTAPGAVSTGASVAGADTTGFYYVIPDTVTVAAPASWVGEGCAVQTSTVTGRSLRLGCATSATSPPTTYELDAGGDGLSVAAGPDGLWGTSDDILDTTANTNAIVPPATLQPIGAYAAVYTANGSIAGRITLYQDLGHAIGPAANNVAPAAAVPGTFVIIADDYPYDPTSTATATTPKYQVPLNNANPIVVSNPNPGLVVGALNGRVFRLGQPVPPDLTATPPVFPGTFELDPLYPMPPIMTSKTLPNLIPITNAGTLLGCKARVFLVGAQRTNAPSNSDSAATALQTLTTYSGNAQDTGVFTTCVPVQ